MELATSKYLADDVINGANSAAVADFNGDGKVDVFLPAHNESPFVARNSTLYLGTSTGGFEKVVLGDAVMAHDAQLGFVNNMPTVIASTFNPGDANPIYSWNNGELKESIGANLSQVFHQSAVLGNFGAGGSMAVAMGDVFSNAPSDNAKIKIYGYANGDLTSTAPLATITPYLSTKHPEFTSHYGPGITHTYRILADDFNHDGKTDLIAEQSMWVQGSAFPSAIQMIQNQGNNQFADKTDQLAAVVNQASEEFDYQAQVLDVDHSGINSYLFAGLPAGSFVDNKFTYDNSRAPNYLLLNDGTGKLYSALHEQFLDFGSQVVQMLNRIQSQYEGTSQSYYIGADIQAAGVPKFVGYQTADGALNYLAEIQVGRWAAPGLWANQYMLVNVPLHYDARTDFTQNVNIDDRNGSSLMRTWAGNDMIHDTGAAAKAHIDGGAGLDTVAYGKNASAFNITRSADGTVNISGEGLSDVLVNIERLKFADKTINLVVKSVASTISAAELKTLEELYVAFFNRTPDADGLEYWIGQFKSGMTVKQTAESFYDAGVQYSNLTGFSANMTNADFVNVVYKNVLGRQSGADAEGLAYWTGALASGAESKGSLVSTILTSAHTFKGNTTWGWVADLLDNKAAIANKVAVQYGLNYNTAEASISEGMKIAAAVTATDIQMAITLIGLSDTQLSI
ncbi:hypothetical protein AYR66_27480 [Noviherbaspirillum denitrificans]|uniref:DUF4214 domain-containing protein n=1 Tax=Noviherbaspirillum denitrificans TaxID=1968433 RepID=A0A254TJ90_9BURK|nr:hypothetical protein AYR66_27480 [Noviherbaspirillum denitrificans]